MTGNSVNEVTDEVYEYMSTIQCQSLEIYNLNLKLQALEIDNKQLKENIQTLAIENADVMNQPYKRKMSRFVLAKWAYYHNHKEDIRSKYELNDWRAIKSKSDELFLL
jgi:hypothetical protein